MSDPEPESQRSGMTLCFDLAYPAGPIFMVAKPLPSAPFASRAASAVGILLRNEPRNVVVALDVKCIASVARRRPESDAEIPVVLAERGIDSRTWRF